METLINTLGKIRSNCGSRSVTPTKPCIDRYLGSPTNADLPDVALAGDRNRGGKGTGRVCLCANGLANCVGFRARTRVRLQRRNFYILRVSIPPQSVPFYLSPVANR